MRPFMTLCMIVKNEEKVLERCLNSVKDVIEEIIIVDTGSTDKTKEIALKFTDIVYDFEWTESFADARNFAQSKAKGEWIFVMDADEFVETDNLQSFIDELKDINKSNIDAYAVKIYNFSGNRGESIVQHNSIRVYRNESSISYYRKIHEQLEKKDGELIVDSSILVLYHSGYLKSVIKEKNKNKRNTELIEKELKISGETGFDYFNLGNEYLSQGMTEKALDSYIVAYQKKPDIRYSWVSYCLIQIVNCLYELNRYQDALKVISDAELIYQESPDFRCIRAMIYLKQKRLDDAALVLEELVNNKQSYQRFITSIDFLEYRPHQMLGSIYKDIKEYEKSTYHFSKALSANKFCTISLVGLMENLSSENNVNEVVQFLDNNGFIKNDRDLGRIINIFISLSKFEFAMELIDKVKDSNLKEGFETRLKYITINSGDFLSFLETKTIQELNYLIENGCFDTYDLILLTFNDNNIELGLVLTKLVKDEGVIKLINYLMEKNVPDVNISNSYIRVFERVLQYKHLHLFEELLRKAEAIKDIHLDLGNLLFNYKYFDQAMFYYKKLNPDQYNGEAFVNIVKYYLEKDEYITAAEWIIIAISQAELDFRLFEFALELEIQVDEIFPWNIDEINILAQQLFPNSAKLDYLNEILKSPVNNK